MYILKGRTATTAVLWCMKSFNFTKECERASRVAVSISTPTRRAEKILSVHIFANSLYFQTSIFFCQFCVYKSDILLKYFIYHLEKKVGNRMWLPSHTEAGKQSCMPAEFDGNHIFRPVISLHSS